jgi:hypothetical protein
LAQSNLNSDGLDGWGWRVAAAVALVALIPYFLTVPAGLQFGDGTELATSAYVLGVPHPTGYPAYMLLLHLWMMAMAIGEPILRSCLFNMVCISLTGGLTGAIFLRVVRQVFPGWNPKAKILASVAVGLLYPVLRFPWSAAIITEVYALQVLLAVATFLAILRLLDRPTALRWIVVAILCALNLAHHRLGLFPTFAGVMGGLWLTRKIGLRPTAGGWAFLLLLPLALYLYLPIRANSNPPINWGNTRTLAATLTHIRGGEYIGDRFLRPAPGQTFTNATYRGFVANQTGQYLADLATMWGAPRQNETTRFDPLTRREFYEPAGPTGWVLALTTLALATYGLWTLWSVPRLRVLLGCILVGGGGSALTGYLYNIPDIRDYNLLIIWGGALLATLGGAALIQFQVLTPRGAGPFHPAAAWLWLLLPLVVFFGNLPEHRAARAYSANAELMASIVLPESMDILPPDSILITTGDDEIFQSWYTQQVRGLRRDVLVFGGNFVAVPWYRGFFTDEQIRKYGIEFAGRTALDPEEFAEQVDRGIIRANKDRRPIFTSSSDRFFLAQLARRYTLRPVLEAPILTRAADRPVTVSLIRILPPAMPESQAPNTR